MITVNAPTYTDDRNEHVNAIAYAVYDASTGTITVSINGETVTPANIAAFGFGGDPTKSSMLTLRAIVPTGKTVTVNSNESTINAGGEFVILRDVSDGSLDIATAYTLNGFTLADVNVVSLHQGGEGNQWIYIPVGAMNVPNVSGDSMYLNSSATAYYNLNTGLITVSIGFAVVQVDDINIYGTVGAYTSSMTLDAVIPAGKTVTMNSNGDTFNAGQSFTILHSSAAGPLAFLSDYTLNGFTLADIKSVNLIQHGDGNQWLNINVKSLPGIVASFSAIPVPDRSAVSLTWTAPTVTGSSPIINYAIRWVNNTTGENSPNIYVGPIPLTEYQLTVPSWGDYSFNITAINTDGMSPEMVNAHGVIVNPPPGQETAPGMVAYLSVNGGAGVAEIEWGAPAYTGGSPITGYKVSWTNISRGATATDISFGSADISGTLTELQGGNYLFSIVVVNAIGDSQPYGIDAVSVSPASGAEPPDAPSSFTVGGLHGSATLSWEAPQYTGGEPITEYRMRWDNVITGASSTYTSLGSEAQSGYMVTPLGAGMYTFYMIAVNSAGYESTPIIAVNIQVMPVLILPDQVTGVNATATADGAIVTWAAVAGASTYEVTWESALGKKNGTQGGIPGTSYTITGLPAYTQYTVRVIAMNSDGNGPYSTPQAFTTTGGGGGSGGAVPCFLAGAPVLTPAGYKPIDSLTEGDHVTTGDGRSVSIQRIKRTLVTAGPAVDPYVIPKGRFGATRRLLISPNHRVQTADGMQEARHLGLRQEEQSGHFVYYNLELPEWGRDTLVVAGVICESLAPVRRITVPAAVFKALVAKKYGAITPAVAAKIQRTCRFLANGDVECPVMRR